MVLQWFSPTDSLTDSLTMGFADMGRGGTGAQKKVTHNDAWYWVDASRGPD